MCMALPRGGPSEPPGGALRQLGRLFAFAALFAWLLGAGVWQLIVERITSRCTPAQECSRTYR